MSEAIQYFEKLGLEETFSRLIHVFRQRWAVFTSITVLAYIVIALVTFLSMMVLIPFLSSRDIYDEYGSMNLTLYYVHVALIALVQSAIFYAIKSIADGAIIRAVAEIYTNQVPTVHNSLQEGVRKLGPLFCTAVLLGAVIGIPALLMIGLITVVANSSDAIYYSVIVLIIVVACVAAWVMVVTYHVYPSIIVENLSTISSIQRSWELSKGHRFYIFSTVLIFVCIKFLLSYTSKAIGRTGGDGAYMFSHILALLVNIFMATFQSM